MQKIIKPSTVKGVVPAPTSKSYAQRAVAAALLAQGVTTLTNMELCEDTQAAINIAQILGADIANDGTTYTIKGGFAPRATMLNVGESGLATRLFTPIASLATQTITITGEGSILNRPMEHMRAPLEQLGVRFTSTNGHLPLTVTGRISEAELNNRISEAELNNSISEAELNNRISEAELPHRIAELNNRISEAELNNRIIEAELNNRISEAALNNRISEAELNNRISEAEVAADGSISSQFITGLLMTLPLAHADTTLHVSDLKSRPYVDMTIEILREFGIEIENDNYKTFHIRADQQYKATQYNIPGDWSGASCLLVAGAIAGEITVENLDPRSLQADRRIIDALMEANAGITLGWDSITTRKSRLKGFVFDAMNCPDLFPALVALAANCQGETKIVGTDRLIHKESNRAETLAAEFGKLGIIIDLSQRNIMRIEKGTPPPAAEIKIDSHGDHRIAMAMAVAALTMSQSVTISGAEAVSKSYPKFWEVLSAICTEKHANLDSFSF